MGPFGELVEMQSIATDVVRNDAQVIPIDMTEAMVNVDHVTFRFIEDAHVLFKIF